MNWLPDLPLSGYPLYITAGFAGLFLGIVLARSGAAASDTVRQSLGFKNLRLIRTIVCAALTAILLQPLLALHFSTAGSLPSGSLWCCLFGGILAGAGLFLSGRTLFSAIAGIGIGELHALWFLAGGAAFVWAYEEWDPEFEKWLSSHDFSLGSFSSPKGWEFFHPSNPGLWAACVLALLFAAFYFAGGKRDKDSKTEEKKKD